MNNSSSIHVLVVIRHPVGGIRSFLRDVYSHFKPGEFKLTFLLPRTSELDALRENLKGADCTFLILEKNAGVLMFVKSLLPILKKEDIDVIHSNGFTAMIASVVPAFWYKIPHILTAHDTFTEQQFAKFKGTVQRAMLGVCFHFVDVIHSVSHDAQKNLLDYFPSLRAKISKLAMVPNGVNPAIFLVDDREDWRKKLGLDKNVFLIGYFGRFMAPKGFRYLVEAIDIISKTKKEIKFVVLAFGWGGFIREEQAEIRQKGLGNYFHFLPFQENPARAMRGVDVIVMPSLSEAYGLLAAEAMVAGVPLIGTDCIGLREVLQDTPARMVPTANSRALAEAIMEEIRFPSGARMEQFRIVASKLFDVAHSAEGMKNLITKLLDWKEC